MGSSLTVNTIASIARAAREDDGMIWDKVRLGQGVEGLWVTGEFTWKMTPGLRGASLALSKSCG